MHQMQIWMDTFLHNRMKASAWWRWTNGGIGFVTALEAGLDSKVIITGFNNEYLSAWIDWNQDGSFDSANEQVFTDYLLAAEVRTTYS